LVGVDEVPFDGAVKLEVRSLAFLPPFKISLSGSLPRRLRSLERELFESLDDSKSVTGFVESAGGVGPAFSVPWASSPPSPAELPLPDRPAALRLDGRLSSLSWDEAPDSLSEAAVLETAEWRKGRVR